MRAFKILPVGTIKAANLSKDALKRLTWIDWYFDHGSNAESTCRHFSISKSVFYRWFNRFNKYNLCSLEFDTKTRRPHKLREMTTDPKILQKIYAIRLNDPEKSKYEIHEELRNKYPGVLVDIDTKHLYILGKRFYLFAAIDKKKIRLYQCLQEWKFTI